MNITQCLCPGCCHEISVAGGSVQYHSHEEASGEQRPCQPCQRAVEAVNSFLVRYRYLERISRSDSTGISGEATASRPYHCQGGTEFHTEPCTACHDEFYRKSTGLSRTPQGYRGWRDEFLRSGMDYARERMTELTEISTPDAILEPAPEKAAGRASRIPPARTRALVAFTGWGMTVGGDLLSIGVRTPGMLRVLDLVRVAGIIVLIVFLCMHIAAMRQARKPGK